MRLNLRLSQPSRRLHTGQHLPGQLHGLLGEPLSGHAGPNLDENRAVCQVPRLQMVRKQRTSPPQREKRRPPPLSLWYARKSLQGEIGVRRILNPVRLLTDDCKGVDDLFTAAPVHVVLMWSKCGLSVGFGGSNSRAGRGWRVRAKKTSRHWTLPKKVRDWGSFRPLVLSGASHHAAFSPTTGTRATLAPCP